MTMSIITIITMGNAMIPSVIVMTMSIITIITTVSAMIPSVIVTTMTIITITMPTTYSPVGAWRPPKPLILMS